MKKLLFSGVALAGSVLATGIGVFYTPSIIQPLALGLTASVSIGIIGGVAIVTSVGFWFEAFSECLSSSQMKTISPESAPTTLTSPSITLTAEELEKLVRSAASFPATALDALRQFGPRLSQEQRQTLLRRVADSSFESVTALGKFGWPSATEEPDSERRFH